MKVETAAKGATRTSTDSVKCLVVPLDVFRAPAPAVPRKFTSIDALVERMVRDPKKKEAIALARAELAGDDESLRGVRRRAGKSQADVAIALGTTQSHVARIEAGHNVQVDTLVRLAAVLNVTPEAVFSAYMKRYQ